jgi:hypothetical protein
MVVDGCENALPGYFRFFELANVGDKFNMSLRVVGSAHSWEIKIDGM